MPPPEAVTPLARQTQEPLARVRVRSASPPSPRQPQRSSLDVGDADLRAAFDKFDLHHTGRFNKVRGEPAPRGDAGSVPTLLCEGVHRL